MWVEALLQFDNLTELVAVSTRACKCLCSSCVLWFKIQVPNCLRCDLCLYVSAQQYSLWAVHLKVFVPFILFQYSDIKIIHNSICLKDNWYARHIKTRNTGFSWTERVKLSHEQWTVVVWLPGGKSGRSSTECKDWRTSWNQSFEYKEVTKKASICNSDTVSVFCVCR